MRTKTALTKSCALCGVTFSQRKPSGKLYTSARWDQKKCCSNKCHTQYHWNQRREDVPTRFWRQVDKGDEGACWNWLGAARDHKGYGGFHWVGKKMMRAHRAAWLLTNGPIEDGLIVRHMCDNRKCCNPSHLELGTLAENTRDRDERLRGAWQYKISGHLSEKEVKAMLASFKRWGKTTDAAKDLSRDYGLKTSQFWAYVRQNLASKPIVA